MAEEWWRWWRKNRGKLVVGAAVGIAADSAALYFLLISQYTSSLLFGHAVAVLIGILVGFVAIEVFAFSPKLWPKLAGYLDRHQTNPPPAESTFE